MRNIIISVITLVLPSCVSTTVIQPDNLEEKILVMAENLIVKFIKNPEHRPKVFIVDQDHKFFESKKVVAKSIILDGTREELLINRNMLDSDVSIEDVIKHEIAHFIAWYKYGFDIPIHGVKFKKECKKLTTRSYCKGA